MNAKRYLIFGGISLTLHSLILLAKPAQNELNIAMDSTTSSLSLQFIATPKKTVETQKKSLPDKTHDISEKKAMLTEKETITTSKKKPPKKRLIKRVAPPIKSVTKDNERETAEPKTVKSAPKKNQTKESTDNPISPINSAVNTPKASTPKLLEKPTFKAKPTPVAYPRLAKRRGQQGKVLIEVWIDHKGKQIKQFIVDSSGHSTLDDAALTAISNWQFNVSVEQGYTIAHRVQIPVTFKLDR